MIAWTDVETTGLTAGEDHLLEVAIVITDDDLNELAATSVVVRPVGLQLRADGMPDIEMDDVVREMHTKNGLFREVAASELHRYEGEQKLIDFVKGVYATVPDVSVDKCVHCKSKAVKHIPVSTPNSNIQSLRCVGEHEVQLTTFEPKMVSALSKTPLAGSTVGFDRAFLSEHMPLLQRMFSYRSIDVSSFTEVAERWSPFVHAGRPKASETSSHRALPDVRESIAYLRYYRQCGFIATIRSLVTPPTPWPAPPMQCWHLDRDTAGNCTRCGQGLFG